MILRAKRTIVTASHARKNARAGRAKNGVSLNGNEREGIEMAEFAEIAKQARRMCKYYQKDKSCARCPLSIAHMCRMMARIDAHDAIEIERIVTAWAAEHPVPVYPSWREAWQSLFQGAENPCPEQWFCEGCPKDMECFDCIERPMSKKVAEKLGIKPITTAKAVPEHDGCEGCRWMDKHTDDEPCMRCRNTQLVGSARWTEMPDLWEKDYHEQ